MKILMLTVLAVLAVNATPVTRREDSDPSGEKISKRSTIFREHGFVLPSERITKRDLKVQEKDDMEEAASSIVFRPLFSYRGLYDQRRFVRSINNKDLDSASSSLVFVPSFRRKNRRISRSAEDFKNDRATAECCWVFLPKRRNVDETTKTKRSTEDKEDIDGAESSLVFLPSFRRSNRRYTRSLNDKQEKMDGAESSLVFLPSFRRSNRRRLTRSTEDMDNAESSLVFLPNFRRSNRRRFTRSAEDKKEEMQTARKVSRATNDVGEDMDTAGSSLVFPPSFARRQYSSLSDDDYFYDDYLSR